jgi:hypothetical protein
MKRDVFLLPAADVHGGVWSNELSVTGPNVQVAGSVYAQGSITIEEDETDELPAASPVTFGGSLTSPESLLMDTREVKTRVLSDVYTKRANINRAFIFGNVYADGAVIRNSVVLGGIFCKGALDLSNSFVHTFQAHRATIGEGVSIFAPFATADDGITLNAPVRSMTFADVFDDGLLEAEIHGDVVHLDEDDLFEVDTAAGSAEGDGAPVCQTVLSMTERILDSSLVQDRLQTNKELLRRLSLSRHIRGQDQVVRDLEENLWAVIDDPKSEDKSSRRSRSLKDLLDRFGLSNSP